MDLITFGLAFVAYVLLAAEVVARAWKKRSRALTIDLAVILTAHVGLVWGYRFEGSVETALAKGLAGFLIFHGAYIAIIAAAAAREPWATRLLVAAFPVASVGAIGAAFKYDYVSGLRYPLLGVLMVAMIGAGLGVLRARRSSLPAERPLDEGGDPAPHLRR